MEPGHQPLRAGPSGSHALSSPRIRIRLRLPIGLAHTDVHADPVAVLHEHMHAVLEVRHP
jgi:hypothetical protein